MKKQILSEELLRMKRLAGLINEGQYNEKFEVEKRISPEQAVNKAMPYADKLDSSSKIDSLADKIVDNPDLLNQLEKLIKSSGLNINESDTNVSFNTDDIGKLALFFSKKEINEEIGIQENDEDYDGGGAASVFLGAFGGGALGASLSATIIAAIPGIASIFAGPAVLGAIAGVALGVLAKKVYDKLIEKPSSESSVLANTGDKEKDSIINAILKLNYKKGTNDNPDFMSKYSVDSLKKYYSQVKATL